MENKSAVKLIEQYCGPYINAIEQISKITKIIAVIAFVIFFLFTLKSDLYTKLLLYIFPIVIFAIGVAVSYESPANKTKRKLKKYRKQGILNALTEEFTRREPRYDDALRLGETSIFGNGKGEFAPLSMITRISRVKHDYYRDGSFTRTELFIEIKYNVSSKKLCDLTNHNIFNEDLWKAFGEEIRWRNPKIKIIDKVESRVTHTSSNDGD